MIENFLEKRKLILTFLFFFIFFGLQKYVSLPKESDPDISIPVIYVSLAHKGISPDDSERLLIKPMEKELKNIEGVKKISSKLANKIRKFLLKDYCDDTGCSLKVFDKETFLKFPVFHLNFGDLLNLVYQKAHKKDLDQT